MYIYTCVYTIHEIIASLCYIPRPVYIHIYRHAHTYTHTNVCIPHESLLGIRQVSNLCTSIDPGSLKIGFLVLIQNAGFVRDYGTN